MATLVEVPHLGMDLHEVTIIKWLVSEGDEVTKGTPILTIETDKTNYDLEAEANGTIHRLRGEPGDVLAVGSPLAWIVEEGEQPPEMPEGNEGDATAREAERQQRRPEERLGKTNTETPSAVRSLPGQLRAARGLASPAARREAARRGMDIADITGTGPGGVVYLADLPAQEAPPSQEVRPEPAGMEETMPLSRIRRLTGERTQRSFRDTPHFYVERDVVVDGLFGLRDRLAHSLGKKPSLGALLSFAVARTLPDHPLLNARFAEDSIRLQHVVGLGVAVATEEGLIVPVVRDADRLRIGAFLERYYDLTERARHGELQGNEASDGTFTVSNLGMFGVDRFSAIINPPQAAILAFGRVRTVPLWDGGQWQPKRALCATVSADHRVTDGAGVGRFLDDLAKRLDRFELLL